MSNRLMHPFVKWAGGKTQLLDKLLEKAPTEYGTYYEPFVGAGALLFALHPKKAIINDINPQLMNVYRQIKKDPEGFYDLVVSFDVNNIDKDYYLKVRERYNQKILNKKMDAECAALMVWLNKHCFNGLYRVNSKGLFNVPFNNNSKPTAVESENFYNIGKFLRKVKIYCLDFEGACKDVEKNDFVYFDSPYIPVSETAYFTDYTEDGFSMTDHERLAKLFRKLDKKGAKVLLTNHDVPLTYELYKGYDIEAVDVRRMINSKASNRTGREVIIKNY